MHGHVIVRGKIAWKRTEARTRKGAVQLNLQGGGGKGKKGASSGGQADSAEQPLRIPAGQPTIC
jgi:hypothetical protein